MSAALYLDDDTGIRALQSQARRAGLEVVRSDDVGMRGARDDDHLRFANGRGMIVVSCNVRDFMALPAEWIERGESHAGILLADPEVPAGERIRRLLFIAAAAEPQDFANHLSWLKDWA